MRNTLLTALLFSTFATLSANASDWTQWFGPNHDGSSDEKMPAPWPAAGLKQVWKVPVGEGLGTIAVAGGKAYLMAETEAGKGQKGGVESLVCLDALTGAKLWASPVGITIFEKSGNDGPRSTPAIDSGLVYVVGTFLTVGCFDAKTGGKVWMHDLPTEFKGAAQLNSGGIKQWGCANSPVVDGDLVFVHGGGPGQAFIAFNKKDGSVAWKSGDDEIWHTTPTVATIQGVRQVIFFSKTGLASFETKTGKELWRYPFKGRTSVAISPVVSGDIVYCGGGYDVGSALVKIVKAGDTFKVAELRNDTTGPADQKLFSHWSTPVAKDGYFYGLIGFKEFGTEPLKCVEMATGKIMWSHPGFGQGGTMLIDGKVLIQGDKGQLVLCEASPAGYKELGQFQAFQLASRSVRSWNAPSVSNGKVYARTSKEAACFDLGK